MVHRSLVQLRCIQNIGIRAGGHYYSLSTHAADLLGERDEVGLALRHDGLHEARRGGGQLVVVVYSTRGAAQAATVAGAQFAL